MSVNTFLKEFTIFLKKQASAALFGGIMLFFLIVTRYIEVPGIHRYDLLLVLAIVVQIILIVTKLEHPREIAAIIIFHICAMGMEIFKVSPEVGSWAYPEPAIFALMGVPLFSGFMYSSVGSYIARIWRISEFGFKNFPRKSILVLLGLAIYVNYFTNHYTYDVRWIIFGLLVIVFWKTKMYVTVSRKRYQIHPLILNTLSALVIWGSEQAGTFARVWIYPNQVTQWHPVSFHMFTSWYLLMILSFIIISLLQPKLLNEGNSAIIKS